MKPRAISLMRSTACSFAFAITVWACPDRDCFCVPTVQSIELSPGNVYAAPGDVFQVRARLLDGDGKEIPEFFGFSPQWQATPDGALKVLSRERHFAVFEVAADAAGVITVTAEATPGVSTSQVITIVAATDGSQAFILAEHQAGSQASIVMIEDGAADGWEPSRRAFVRIAPLGSLNDPPNNPPGGLLLFSAGREMAYAPAAWTPNPPADLADFVSPVAADPVRIGRPLAPPLDIPLDVYIDPSAPGDDWNAITAEAIARIHVADASRIFAANRAGVTFSVAQVQPLNPVVDDCSDYLDPVVAARHNVFYVDMGGDTGFTCNDAQGHTRIFISSRNPFPTTLAHELGHLLSLGEMDDLGEHNLMKQGDNDEPRLRRSRLSLGQVCALNWRSFLWNDPGRSWRPASNTEVVCPPLLTDLQ